MEVVWSVFPNMQCFPTANFQEDLRLYMDKDVLIIMYFLRYISSFVLFLKYKFIYACILICTWKKYVSSISTQWFHKILLLED